MSKDRDGFDYVGYAYSPVTGKRKGLRARESVTWEMTVAERHADTVQIEATCYGKPGDVWQSVLTKAEVEPDDTW